MKPRDLYGRLDRLERATATSGRPTAEAEYQAAFTELWEHPGEAAFARVCKAVDVVTGPGTGEQLARNVETVYGTGRRFKDDETEN